MSFKRFDPQDIVISADDEAIITLADDTNRFVTPLDDAAVALHQVAGACGTLVGPRLDFDVTKSGACGIQTIGEIKVREA